MCCTVLTRRSCLFDLQPRPVPEVPFGATRCLHCSGQSDRSYGPDGISCAMCEPGSQPDHLHEAACTYVPGTKICKDIDTAPQQVCVPIAFRALAMKLVTIPAAHRACKERICTLPMGPPVQMRPGKQPNPDRSACFRVRTWEQSHPQSTTCTVQTGRRVSRCRHATKC